MEAVLPTYALKTFAPSLYSCLRAQISAPRLKPNHEDIQSVQGSTILCRTFTIWSKLHQNQDPKCWNLPWVIYWSLLLVQWFHVFLTSVQLDFQIIKIYALRPFQQCIEFQNPLGGSKFMAFKRLPLARTSQKRIGCPHSLT